MYQVLTLVFLLLALSGRIAYLLTKYFNINKLGCEIIKKTTEGEVYSINAVYSVISLAGVSGLFFLLYKGCDRSGVMLFSIVVFCVSLINASSFLLCLFALVMVAGVIIFRADFL